MGRVAHQGKLMHLNDLPPVQIDWTGDQRRLFLRINSAMREDPQLFQKRTARYIPIADWETIAWSCAWYAAHCIGEKTTGDTGPAELKFEDTMPP